MFIMPIMHGAWPKLTSTPLVRSCAKTCHGRSVEPHAWRSPAVGEVNGVDETRLLHNVEVVADTVVNSGHRVLERRADLLAADDAG